jgi:hypothetical protein
MMTKPQDIRSVGQKLNPKQGNFAQLCDPFNLADANSHRQYHVTFFHDKR